jgi:hypothetical protein
MKTITLECSGEFFLVKDKTTILLRCGSWRTDLGEYESFPEFIKKHGGINGTHEYLNLCYKNQEELLFA